LPQRPLFEKLLGMASLENVYIKVSALPAISREPYPHKDVLELVQRLFSTYGPQRLIWGSDHAMTQATCDSPSEKGLALIDMALQHERAEDRAWVKGGTAARLWNLG
jgi:L-fuconolactonase